MVRIQVALDRIPATPWWRHAVCVLAGHQWTSWFRQPEPGLWGRLCRRCHTCGWYRRR